MNQSQPNDVWAIGAAYEPYVGRWSRLVAREFLAWLAVPPAKQWLDIGCGTGALNQVILEVASPSKVKGVDLSEGYIAFARDQVADDRVSFSVGDAQAIPLESAQYDAVVSGLVLNFVPQPDLAVSEMLRVARPGGIVAAYVWDYADQMQLMRYFWDTAVKLDLAAFDLDEGQRFQICKPEPLTKLFHTAKLNNIEVRAIDVPTVFRDFDDYWRPFLGGQAPAPTYAMSLSEDRRTTLREEIRANLPIATDGSIHLIARAWAIRGVLQL
jgi:SAM-dependent methyltransferase